LRGLTIALLIILLTLGLTRIANSQVSSEPTHCTDGIADSRGLLLPLLTLVTHCQIR
jgi:hypothetical protein